MTNTEDANELKDPFWLYNRTYESAGASRLDGYFATKLDELSVIDIGEMVNFTKHLSIMGAPVDKINVFKIFAIQYAAAPPPVHLRDAIAIRGFDGGVRHLLHLWTSKNLKNMRTKSVDDPLAPQFQGQELRSFTLRRKRDSEAIGNDEQDLELHRQLHPANAKGKILAVPKRCTTR